MKMGEENLLVVQDLETLDLWQRRLYRTSLSRRLPALNFSLQQFSEEENHSFELEANRLQNECGCTVGGIFVCGTLLFLFSYFLINGKYFGDLTVTDILFDLFLLCVASIFGKFAGLLFARLKLLRVAASLRNSLLDEERQWTGVPS
jgi:hypothetical protein